MLTLAVDILVRILQREGRFLAFLEIRASKLETGIQSWNTEDCRDILTGSSPTPDKLFPFQPVLVGSHAQALPLTWVVPGKTLLFHSNSILVQRQDWSFPTFPSLHEGIASVNLNKHYSSPCSHKQMVIHNTNGSAIYSNMLLFMLWTIISMDPMKQKKQKALNIKIVLTQFCSMLASIILSSHSPKCLFWQKKD